MNAFWYPLGHSIFIKAWNGHEMLYHEYHTAVLAERFGWSAVDVAGMPTSKRRRFYEAAHNMYAVETDRMNNDGATTS